MKKLFVVTAFAFAAHSAAACDWNREASAKDQVVATTDLTASPTCSGPNCPSPQPTSVASEETRRATAEPAPVVLITSRH